jgi:hypothetical protein
VLTASEISAMIALMMEELNTFETSVNVYEIIRHNNPEESDIHTQNLKAHLSSYMFLILLLRGF